MISSLYVIGLILSLSMKGMLSEDIFVDREIKKIDLLECIQRKQKVVDKLYLSICSAMVPVIIQKSLLTHDQTKKYLLACIEPIEMLFRSGAEQKEYTHLIFEDCSTEDRNVKLLFLEYLKQDEELNILQHEYECVSSN